jgi:hypothetical protein
MCVRTSLEVFHMTDFIFRLDGFHLTKDQTNQISAAIQSAVTSELARLDLHASTSASAGASAGSGKTAAAGLGTFAHYPILWNGGMLLKELASLQGALKQIPSVTTSPIAG